MKKPLEDPPSLWSLLQIWLTLSVQSFGGGVATLALIRQVTIERHHWLTEEEFARDWALVQVVPGINLIALTILIGKRIAGWRGIGVCLFGLLLPSVTITILLTAGYAHIQGSPLMKAALHGIVPATVGLGLVTAVQMARPTLIASQKAGTLSLLISLLILTASAMTILWRSGAVLPILIMAGLVGALLHWYQDRKSKAQPKGAA